MGGMQETGNEPHAKRRGRLRNNNPSGDPSKAPRCLAKTRANGLCAAPAMANGRCRMHGGWSTGPRSIEGRKRSCLANWKHGRYSAAAKAQSGRLREFLQDIKRLTSELCDGEPT
jgi:hypothetical protein